MHSKSSNGAASGVAAFVLPTAARSSLMAIFAGFAATLVAAVPAGAAAQKDYGKPGEPIELVIGYQPYYTESWSGVIMRDKKYYEKYLPKGSNVSFQIGLQGAIIVNGMLAGKVDVGYVGDMPGIVSTSHPDVRDVRIVSVLGLGYDQCNIFLARPDAPQFKSPEEAIKWLNGKTVAVPKGSCTDRFAQAVFKRFDIKPSEYLNQSIEVITSGFRAKKLDPSSMDNRQPNRLPRSRDIRGANGRSRRAPSQSLPQPRRPPRCPTCRLRRRWSCCGWARRRSRCGSAERRLMPRSWPSPRAMDVDCASWRGAPGDTLSNS